MEKYINIIWNYIYITSSGWTKVLVYDLLSGVDECVYSFEIKQCPRNAAGNPSEMSGENRPGIVTGVFRQLLLGILEIPGGILRANTG